MAQTKTVHTLERARDAFVDIRDALENKTGESLDEIPVEQYDDIIEAIPSGEPVLDTLNVTPSTNEQTIVPEQGIDGFNSVYVDAVDNSIDSNIVAGNIKKDVEILGVTGTYEGSGGNLESNKNEQPYFDQGDVVVTPTSGYDGMEQVTIIKDNNLIPENIKNGVEVFGIYGNYTGDPGIDVKDTPVNLQVVPFSGTVGNRLARALVNLNGTLYLMWNDKLYSYDDYSDSWTEYDSNAEFLGPQFGASQLENPIADDAVLIGSNIVWLYVTGNKVHARWYEVYTKTLSSDVEINLSTPTAYAMQIKALCVDNNSYGSDIYFYENQNNAIYKLRLDVTQGTATLDQFFSNATDNIGFYKLVFIENNLYGIANDGLYKIEYASATKVVTFSDTTSLYRDLIAVDGLGIIYSGGSKDTHSLYLYDISSNTSTLLHTSTTAVYMDSCTCIKDGKIYRYVYRTGTNNWDYVNKFERILDNIPVLVIGTNPALYSWGSDRYINTVVVKNMG